MCTVLGRSIVAKCPGMAGTVPEFKPMSRACPGLQKITLMSCSLVPRPSPDLSMSHTAWERGPGIFMIFTNLEMKVEYFGQRKIPLDYIARAALDTILSLLVLHSVATLFSTTVLYMHILFA